MESFENPELSKRDSLPEELNKKKKKDKMKRAAIWTAVALAGTAASVGIHEGGEKLKKSLEQEHKEYNSKWEQIDKEAERATSVPDGVYEIYAHVNKGGIIFKSGAKKYLVNNAEIQDFLSHQVLLGPDRTLQCFVEKGKIYVVPFGQKIEPHNYQSPDEEM